MVSGVLLLYSILGAGAGDLLDTRLLRGFRSDKSTSTHLVAIHSFSLSS